MTTRIYDVEDARAMFDSLLEIVFAGEDVILTRNGDPVAKLMSADETQRQARKRFGFLEGQFSVPDDFNTMFADEIAEMFYGSDAVASDYPTSPLSRGEDGKQAAKRRG